MGRVQVTIKDIARRLNISTSTVSRALNNHPDINKTTKEAVRDLAKELKYEPNTVALNLRNQKTNTIGVLVPEIANHFFSTAISGIQEVAYEAGYHVLIAQSNESSEREKLNTRALLASRVDGMIAAISMETETFDHFQEIMDKGVPLVLFDRINSDLKTSTVVVDDFEGAFQAVEHLIATGHRRIAHIAGPANLTNSQQRLKGYREALHKHHIPIDETLIAHSDFSQENASKVAEKLLQASSLPDAFFCVNDRVAIGAMLAVKAAGLHIPRDIALVGFNNQPVTAIMEPPISSVSQPAYDMGKAAARILFNQVLEPSNIYTLENLVLKTHLVVRHSSGIK